MRPFSLQASVTRLKELLDTTGEVSMSVTLRSAENNIRISVIVEYVLAGNSMA